MIKNILNQINQIAKHSDNISFKIIAEFIVNNFEDLDSYTIFDVSKLTNTSASTITRFCKKLGLSGYKSLYWTIQTHKKMVELQNEAPYEEVQCLMTENIINSISGSACISKHKIEEIVKLINDAKNIFIFGVGDDSFLIHLFINWVIRLNLKTFYTNDLTCQNSFTEIISDKDIAILISYSFENKEINNIAKKINEKNINVITITNDEINPIIKNKDHVLKLPMNESVNKTLDECYFSKLYYLRVIYYKLLELNKNKVSLDKLCIN
ncbi:GntR family transcriptional regulator [Spiroplasma litorale]|uniref:GntR family transcriptional regulator n=1 Tax=Spiroplasma litorale TaxID=216942 RepID=A0A0K1W1G3_9MOLU|nr:MurR/RpiR family transcriptional regulator [Spiroplasma litorale]AKX34164.1 GntR family transcriptional regulator [Spiroplasma litorale]